MPYVERDASGKIKGCYMVRQPARADEEITADAPELLAYLSSPAPVPKTISDRQFFQQLAILGIISQEAAEEAAGPGTIPAVMLPLIDALPEQERFPARMMLRGATQFDRCHPVTLAMGQVYGWNDAQLDALWTAAAAL